jgi:hypothetical protein
MRSAPREITIFRFVPAHRIYMASRPNPNPGTMTPASAFNTKLEQQPDRAVLRQEFLYALAVPVISAGVICVILAAFG